MSVSKKGKRTANKSLKAWVAFVKKVQKEEKLNYKDAIHRAKQRKDKGEKWMKGGDPTPESPVKPEDTIEPSEDTEPSSSYDDNSEFISPNNSPTGVNDIVGGRRKRKTKRRGHRRRRHTRRR
jgi:hypothetical protein